MGFRPDVVKFIYESEEATEQQRIVLGVYEEDLDED
jgi:hypothetical protein